MLTGQIGIIPNPVSFGEKLICWGTNSNYFHCVLAISEFRTVSAEPGGAVYREIDDWPGTVWSHFDLTSQERHDIVHWRKQFIDTPYNWLDDAMIGLGIKFGYQAPQWVKKWLSSDDRLECAQLCDSAYAHAGVHLFNDGRLPGGVWPGAFEGIWKQRGWL